MDTEAFYFEEGFPFQGRKRIQLEDFLKKNDLTYDKKIQYSVMLKTGDGKLAGCGSRHENILKCIAIDPAFQGEGCLQRIMTALLKNASQSGISHLFLFTKPMYQQMFSDMGFYPITRTDEMLFMENRKNGICEYLEQEASQILLKKGETAGAIVMNANPFTNGHRYLVETAAASCEVLHVFVLSEDASDFPADIRLALVKRGCADLKNVFVHGSSDYLISHATFPDYFLKEKAAAPEKAALLDLQIFGQYFKPAFHLTKRFVGEEPFCPTTRAYNEQMKKVLPDFGIRVIEIPRCTGSDGTAISATLVRRSFLFGSLEDVRPLVPQTTYAWLSSSEGQSLKEKLLLEKENES